MRVSVSAFVCVSASVRCMGVLMSQRPMLSHQRSLHAHSPTRPTSSFFLPPAHWGRQLSWLVYLIGGLVGGRVSSPKSEENDLIDGELAARIFNLMQVQT